MAGRKTPQGAAASAASEEGAGSVLRLCLLGPPRLIAAGNEVKLERKDALMLLWLALEGPTPRARMAALLFPDADEAGARGALRQRLFRARLTPAAALIAGDDPMRIAENVVVDLADPAAPGDLLGGLAIEDLPEIEEWLATQRARRLRGRIDWFAAGAENAEATGDLAAAIGHARNAVDADPLFEPSYRRLMRLHYLHGDPVSARAAYQALVEILRRELGASPSRETEELRRQIGSDATLPVVARAMPVTVLRPPRLIGRDREWMQLNESFAARAASVVSGEPGMGKSRLVADLARAQAGALVISARPGDEDAPYSVLSRLLRSLLQSAGAISPGVAKELARLLPELGDAEPMKSSADRVRFLNAIESLAAQASAAGLRGLIIDDLQYTDAASTEALQHLSGRKADLAWVATFRTGELSAAGRAFVEALAGTHDSASLRLQPLSTAEIAELIGSLGIAELDGNELAAPLARRTGGNPLFLLEAIKSLLGQGAPALAVKGIPAATSVGALIERRIAQLSPGAIKLARCAAVAGQDHSIDLAARVLGVRPLDLADAWNELENAQVLRDGAFAHDLVYEAALASVPPPIAQHLHGEIAAYLQQREGAPSRVAAHFEAASQPESAAESWVRSGEAAQHAMRFAEATDAFERAARLLGERGSNERAFDAAFLMRTACFEVDLAARSSAALELLDRFATTPVQRAIAHNEHAVTLLHRGDMPATERHALAGLNALGGADEPLLRAQLRRNLAAVFAWRDDDIAAALRELRSVQADVERLGSPMQRFEVWESLAILLGQADQSAEAQVMFHRAIDCAIENGNLPGAAQTLLNLAVNYFDCGEAKRAMSSLERARGLLAAVGDDLTPYSSLNLNYGLTMRALGEYASSLDHFDRALARAREQTPGWVPLIAASKAQTLVYLGQFARAQKELADSPPDQGAPRVAACKWQAMHYMLARAQGRSGGESLSLLIDAFPRQGRQLVRWRLQAINLAGRENDANALAGAIKLVREVTDAERMGLAIHAHARVAAAARRQGQAELGRRHARDALRLMQDYASDDIYPGEVAQIAIASLAEGNADDADEARAALRRAVDWITRTAAEHVPPEYRDSFLTRNPFNRELLTSATRLRS